MRNGMTTTVLISVETRQKIRKIQDHKEAEAELAAGTNVSISVDKIIAPLLDQEIRRLGIDPNG